MRCSMCGVEVGADFEQKGEFRMCRHCAGHDKTYTTTYTTENGVHKGTIRVDLKCGKCQKPIVMPEEWEFVGKEKWHKECAEEKFEKAINPSHYKDKAIETIDIIKSELTTDGFEGFLAGNVLKYVSRYRNKNGIEDLKKAKWYLERLIGEKESNPTSR